MKKKTIKVIKEMQVRVGLIRAGMNRAYLHYDITAERIKKMRSRAITEGEARGKTISKYWNPVYFYPKEVKMLQNEIGHDRSFRYTLKVSLKN